ncbi:hypothetical protein DOU12_11415, partial [Clavibacter michiganensis subsp. michiganensis]|nr:hypothetical protein [Clavibacter michiganensis subsp. michiganensis]
MHEDDDAVSALPVEELRRRVYAQGADEADERWIRAAARAQRDQRHEEDREAERPVEHALGARHAAAEARE